MTTINTQDLTGVALDWAVAKAVKRRVTIPKCWKECKPPGLATLAAARTFPYGPPAWSPSTKPEQSQPIIEREGIALWKAEDLWHAMHPATAPLSYSGEFPYIDLEGWDCTTGPTMLVAGLRCYIRHKLGPMVDVPQELLP